MAFFGAPIVQDDHADRAILAGLMMMERIEQWNVERTKEGLPIVRIRVGINSGPAVVGNVGTEKRVDYTVLGTSVNIASRLESGVAQPGSSSSRRTRSTASWQLQHRVPRRVRLKGAAEDAGLLGQEPVTCTSERERHVPRGHAE